MQYRLFLQGRAMMKLFNRFKRFIGLKNKFAVQEIKTAAELGI
jgi:hypothetical protein